MFKYVMMFIALFLNGPVPVQGGSADEHAKYFEGMRGCFLLYDVKSGMFEAEIGKDNCKERVVACSTFKVPLAAMAFDSGVLKDEDEVLKWDGKKEDREVLNKDHSARTWMKDSVVWFSQRLTPLMGEAKMSAYLKSMDYGNQDLAGGITQAWLVPPDAEGPSLKISAYEQVEFMKKLWTGSLPVSERAMRITRDITYLETSANGSQLNGKTGSNYFAQNRKRRLGWFIARVRSGEKEYIAVTNFSDLAAPSETSYGGVKAKEIAKRILSDRGLW